jgi:hypothetical protein
MRQPPVPPKCFESLRHIIYDGTRNIAFAIEPNEQRL